MMMDLRIQLACLSVLLERNNEDSSTSVADDPKPGNGVAQHRRIIRNLADCIWKVLRTTVLGIIIFFALYYAISSPPMHWFYEGSPSAGPMSVYVPGGGFSGFWFHLGYLNSLGPNIEEYDYYCFSSGCLGILAALLNHSIADVATIGFDVQDAWMVRGEVDRFELVDKFVDDLIENVSDDRLHEILPNLKVLVTTTQNGYEVETATNRNELKDLIAKTTWVPYLTAWGFLSDERDVYLDGGFSRMLHPECAYSLHLPIIWETVIHTFSPGLSREQVMQLSQSGASYDFGLPRKYGQRNEEQHYEVLLASNNNLSSLSEDRGEESVTFVLDNFQ